MGYISGSGTGYAVRTKDWAVSTAKAGSAIAAFILLAGVSPSGELEVNVEHLRSNDGLLHVCVTRNEAHFPDCENDPAATRETFRVRDTQSVHFANLPSGNYAIAILHDENGNSRLDRFAGIPREGIGFSRNPRFSFGPPEFSSASFVLDPRGDVQRVRMRYFL